MPQFNRRELDVRAREYGFNRDTFILFIYPSAKPIIILPCGRQPVVCGTRADLALEGPARNGTICMRYAKFADGIKI